MFVKSLHKENYIPFNGYKCSIIIELGKRELLLTTYGVCCYQCKPSIMTKTDQPVCEKTNCTFHKVY